ncbi:MAG: twin-arginine translocase TatA/TatE family subunit [Sulfolobaceae archaeon]
MIGDITDFLILLLVAVLLFSGDPNIKETAKTLGKTLGELRRRQVEFTNEIKREILEETTNSINNELNLNTNNANRMIYIKPIYYQDEDKIKLLEERIKQLQEEIERLKNEQRRKEV